MEEIDGEGAILNGTLLGKSNLSESNLSQASLKNTDLGGCILVETDFFRANLTNSHFSYETEILRVNFSETTLIGCNFFDACTYGKMKSFKVHSTNWFEEVSKTLNPPYDSIFLSYQEYYEIDTTKNEDYKRREFYVISLKKWLEEMEEKQTQWHLDNINEIERKNE